MDWWPKFWPWKTSGCLRKNRENRKQNLFVNVILCALFFDWRNLYQNGGMPRYLGIDSGYGLWVQHRFQGRSPPLKVEHFTISPRRWPFGILVTPVAHCPCIIMYPCLCARYFSDICSLQPFHLFFETIHHCYQLLTLSGVLSRFATHYIIILLSSCFPFSTCADLHRVSPNKKKRGGRREKPEAIE